MKIKGIFDLIGGICLASFIIITGCFIAPKLSYYVGTHFLKFYGLIIVVSAVYVMYYSVFETEVKNK